MEQKWDNYKKKAKLVNPANRKKLDVIVVGTGLAGSSIAASLGEMGYNVKSFCFQDSPRRAHSVAAQGGVNAAKNYKNDGDSVYRMFVDTLKGGDFRAREANVYRMAECSLNLIDQSVAQEFLSDVSTEVTSTTVHSGCTGKPDILRKRANRAAIAFGSLSGANETGRKRFCTAFSRHEMLDLVVIEGKARGIIVRNLDTGKLKDMRPTPSSWQQEDMEKSITFLL